MLGSGRQLNWKHIAEVHIKLFVIPLKNVGKIQCIILLKQVLSADMVVFK